MTPSPYARSCSTPHAIDSPDQAARRLDPRVAFERKFELTQRRLDQRDARCVAGRGRILGRDGDEHGQQIAHRRAIGVDRGGHFAKKRHKGVRTALS
jgi:hypothetical protein